MSLSSILANVLPSNDGSEETNGLELPPVGTYTIDPAHSSIEFVARHLVAAKVRGRFAEFSGTIVIADPVADSSVEATINPASISTGVDDRDAHLRSADFFDVENNPTAGFRSTAVTATDEPNHYVVQGDLSIAGVTRSVPLALAYNGTLTDPWGNTRITFTAMTEIDREEFGLTWNQAMESGGLIVGRKVVIELEIQATAAPEGEQ